MNAAAGQGPVHRGLMYRSTQHLLEVTAPLVASTLESRGHVVVLSRRWFAAALRDALAGTASDPGLIDYRAARALSHGTVPDLEEQLKPVTHPYRPTLVISQFVPPPTEPDCSPDTVLPSRSTTLLCLCPFGARDDLRTSFHRAHQPRIEAPAIVAPSPPGRGPERPTAARPRAARTGPPSPQPARREAPTVRASFGTVDDLSEVRAQVARAAATAGFGTANRARAVLAVHEAMVLACTLVRDDPETSGTTTPCRLQAYAAPARLVTEIDLPHSISFPVVDRDRDPLAHARAFCHEASWFGSLRTRHIRLITLG